MKGSSNSASIFSHKLDRVVFTAYFLGAVVPLVALCFVTQRFILDSLTDRLEWLGLLGLLGSIGALSLGAFFVIRRKTHQTLDRMDDDNRRLESLLQAANSFGNAQHEAEAAATAVRCALELSGADAVYAFVRSDPSIAPICIESLGKDAEKRLQQVEEPVAAAVDLAMENGRPVMRSAGDGGAWGQTAAAVIPLTGEKKPMGALVALRAGSGAAFEADRVDALSTLAALASVSMHNTDLRDAQRNFFAHMTELLVTALDAHLLHQKGHGNRVAQYANRVGRELQLDEDQLHRLHFAALLHDIGMLKIDSSLLTNARACEKHPMIGARMLERIRLWSGVAPVVLHHHERYDGTGYPEGLVADAIPLEARIIAVCESFDVMVSDSSYKVAMSREEALAELGACSGEQFDPNVVIAFTNLVERDVIQVIR